VNNAPAPSAWMRRAIWFNLLMSVVIVALNIHLLQRRPGDATIWFVILACCFLFLVCGIVLAAYASRKR